MTKRLRDWQSRLADCLAERMALPFAWGSQDCVMFAADCAAAMTGEDPAAGVRGSYRSATGAARVLKDRGGLAAIAADALGPEVGALMAQPGDIGLVANSGQPCLAVWAGASWYAPGPDGLAQFPLEEALHVWRLCREEGAA